MRGALLWSVSMLPDIGGDGCSREDIAAVLGQKSSRVAAYYAGKAGRSKRMRAAVVKLKPLVKVKR